MWQDHLLQVSRLFVEHTKLFMHKNGLHIEETNGIRLNKSSALHQADFCNVQGIDIDLQGEWSI